MESPLPGTSPDLNRSFTVSMPPSWWAVLEHESRKRGKNKSQLVRDLIRQWANEYNIELDRAAARG